MRAISEAASQINRSDRPPSSPDHEQPDGAELRQPEESREVILPPVRHPDAGVKEAAEPIDMEKEVNPESPPTDGVVGEGRRIPEPVNSPQLHEAHREAIPVEDDGSGTPAEASEEIPEPEPTDDSQEPSDHPPEENESEEDR